MALRDVQEILETALEPVDWSGDALEVGYGAYVSPRNPFTVGELYSRVREPARFTPASQVLPEVRLQSASAAAGDSALPTTGDQEVQAEEVIEPERDPTRTVFEDAPGGIYETNRAETDWDEVYRQYVILNTPDWREEEEVAIDWGEIAGSVIGGILDPFGAGAATTSYFQPRGVANIAQVPQSIAPAAGAVTMAAANGGCPPTGPKYGKICLATGVVTPLRRRRRRRLLTSSDIKDLSALKSIVGGAALQGAVVQAVRR